MVALVVTGYTVVSGQQRLSVIETKEYVTIAIGSIMVMFVAQAVYFFGVQVSNMTTMAYTTLAFPINGWPCTSPIQQKRFRPGCQ